MELAHTYRQRNEAPEEHPSNANAEHLVPLLSLSDDQLGVPTNRSSSTGITVDLDLKTPPANAVTTEATPHTILPVVKY